MFTRGDLVQFNLNGEAAAEKIRQVKVIDGVAQAIFIVQQIDNLIDSATPLGIGGKPQDYYNAVMPEIHRKFIELSKDDHLGMYEIKETFAYMGITKNLLKQDVLKDIVFDKCRVDVYKTDNAIFNSMIMYELSSLMYRATNNNFLNEIVTLGDIARKRGFKAYHAFTKYIKDEIFPESMLGSTQFRFKTNNDLYVERLGYTSNFFFQAALNIMSKLTEPNEFMDDIAKELMSELMVSMVLVQNVFSDIMQLINYDRVSRDGEFSYPIKMLLDVILYEDNKYKIVVKDNLRRRFVENFESYLALDSSKRHIKNLIDNDENLSMIYMESKM